MFMKTIAASAFALIAFFASTGNSYSQDDNVGSIQIVVPEINIGSYDDYGYDKEGYDKEGYDKYGYDRTGYNREGYNEKGYDRSGYDRNGYNINGYDKNGKYRDDNLYNHKDKKHKHDNNGKHKDGIKRRNISMTITNLLTNFY